MDGKSGLQTKNAPPKPAFSLSQPGLLQRTCECGGVPGLTGKCEECSSKQLSGQRGTNAPAAPNSSPNDPSITPIQPAKLGGYSFEKLAIAPKERFGIQTKLAIGQPGDRYEQEADRVADQVMRMLPEPGSPMSGFASLLRPPAIQQGQIQPQIQAKPSFRGLSQELAAESQPVQLQEEENKTGLPDDLKTGVENLSGYSLDEVRVHYNSPKPAQLQALAYTQGTEIHVGPGQEKHLPHEAWHIVQQMQGRVKPTMQMKGLLINDDDGLEREATKMGKSAIQNISIVQKSKELARYSPSNFALQRETDSGKNTEQELWSIIHQLEHLQNEAKSLENEEDPAPGLKQLTEKIAKLKEIATGKDEKQKAEALQALKAEIPNGDVSEIEASSAEATTSSSPEHSANKTESVIQQKTSDPIQRVGIAWIIGGVVLGIGAIAGGIYYYVRRRREAIFNEFGNTFRNRDIDPDIIGDGGIHQVSAVDARPEDAPTINYFRERFQKLHSAKLYLENRHPNLVRNFETAQAERLNQLTLKDRFLQISAKVKDESKAYKKDIKNLSTIHSVDVLKETYTSKIQTLGDSALELAQFITIYINQYGEDNTDLNGIHAAGTDIWRQKWHDTIMAVNTVLHNRWPHWRTQIRGWIKEKHDQDHLAYMDPDQQIELDYIGSLAKGYKGPPKQAVRFTPEKFDVDGNLTAPSLAVYALTVGKAIVDRGRIWSRFAGPGLGNSDLGHPGLLQNMENDIQQNLVAAGLINMGMDPNEPFEVVIDAEGIENLANVPPAATDSKDLSERDRTIRDRLYFIRHQAPARFQQIGVALEQLDSDLERCFGTGFIVTHNGEYELREHDEANQAYAFTDEQLTTIEQIISRHVN